MSHQHRLLLGAHMSIAGGFEQAIIRGESIECTTIQLFTKSNRQWNAKQITDEQTELFKQTLKKSSIAPVITHASYLINIGSSDLTTQKKSVAALAEELTRCHMLGIPYLVLHPGSSTGASEKEGLQWISDNLNEALAQTPGSTMILLENMAGQGSSACYKFEHLAFLYKESEHKKRIGICFDTCHAFAAGYDFRTEATYKQLWHDFDEIIGLQHLKAMHINDSKKELGSRVDRHEEIGKGHIGLKAFELLFNDEQFFDVPKILETPKDTLPDYAHNMLVIKNLISDKNKKKLGIE